MTLATLLSSIHPYTVRTQDGLLLTCCGLIMMIRKRKLFVGSLLLCLYMHSSPGRTFGLWYSHGASKWIPPPKENPDWKMQKREPIFLWNDTSMQGNTTELSKQMLIPQGITVRRHWKYTLRLFRLWWLSFFQKKNSIFQTYTSFWNCMDLTSFTFILLPSYYWTVSCCVLAKPSTSAIPLQMNHDPP